MKKGSERKHWQKLASSASSSKGTWSLKDFLVGSDIVAKRKESHDGDTAPKLMVLHATNSHFRSVANYNNYMLLNRLQIYNKNMAAKTGKYFESM